MKTHLNLLPTSVIQRQAIGKLLRTWGYVAGVTAVLAIAWTIYEEHLTAQARQRHADLQADYDATHDTLRNVRLLRSELTAIEQRQTLLPDPGDQRQLLTLLGLFSSAARENAHGVAIESLTYTFDASPPGGPSPSGERSLRVELRGIAADAVALAELVATMRAWEIFTQVDLKSSGEVKVGDVPAHRYVLECIH